MKSSLSAYLLIMMYIQKIATKWQLNVTNSTAGGQPFPPAIDCSTIDVTGRTAAQKCY